MASPQSACRFLQRRPLLLAALVRGLGTIPFQREADQAVTSSTFFFAKPLLERETSVIETLRASTALVNWAIVMHRGGISTTTFLIGLVSRPWRRDSMQTAAAISARAVSIPAINPHWRTSFMPGSPFKVASAELRYWIFGCSASKTRSFPNTSRLALAAAQPRAFPV